jgi:hypothetical protein
MEQPMVTRKIDYWNSETEKWEAASTRVLNENEPRKPFVDVVVVTMGDPFPVPPMKRSDDVPSEVSSLGAAMDDIMLGSFGVTFAGERERAARQRRILQQAADLLNGDPLLRPGRPGKK